MSAPEIQAGVSAEDKKAAKKRWTKLSKAFIAGLEDASCESCGAKPGSTYIDRKQVERTQGFGLAVRPKYDNRLKNHGNVEKALYQQFKATYPLNLQTQFEWVQEHREEIQGAYAKWWGEHFEEPNAETHRVMCTRCLFALSKGKVLCKECGKNYPAPRKNGRGFDRCYPCHIKEQNK